MATFTTHLDHPAQFNDFDIKALDGDYLFLNTPTTHRVGPSYLDPGTNIEFGGVGFTYFGLGLAGGTITSITSHTNGAIDFQFSGISISVAAFNAYQSAGDLPGFLGAVFAGSDTIFGSNGADQLYGFAGDDTITGLDGDDLLDGGASSDTLTGGKGNDSYVLNVATDIIKESGNSTGDWVYAPFSVDLTKDAFDNIENIYLTGIGTVSGLGDGGANIIVGNAANNTLKGEDGNDMLDGSFGADILDGGKGDDQMVGGTGNDTYYVDSTQDTAKELPFQFGELTGGIDLVISSAKSFTLADEIENLTLTGTAEIGNGNDSANKITGNDVANTLDGGGGGDTLKGGKGDDYYIVDDAKDVVTELAGGGTDTIQSTETTTLPNYVENLTLTGTDDVSGTGNSLANLIIGNVYANKIDGKTGNDTLFGGSDDDTLIGGGGDDRLHGQSGDDTLDVSAGNDTVFYSSPVDGHDVIQGFDGNAIGGQDKLDLDGYFDKLGIDPEDRADHIGLVDSGASVEVWIDSEADGSLDFAIVTIQTADAVTIGQDVLIAHGLGEGV